MLGLGTRLPQIARGPREARFTPPPGLGWPRHNGRSMSGARADGIPWG